MQHNTIFVTGGAGFIGSALIRYLIQNTHVNVVNIDKLSYAGNLQSLHSITDNPRYLFSQTDICDKTALEALFSRYRPRGILHLAAESHVDRSISGSEIFIQTNIVGTYTLLEVVRRYWYTLSDTDKQRFRFHHVSTDEVFGSLHETENPSVETSPYMPRNPYSASKASSDHLVHSWQNTYGMPTVLTRCCNNYGPYQLPEKLIPRTIANCLAGKPLPVYGNGRQRRDWIYVEDHVRALWTVFNQAENGKNYNIGADNEQQNIKVIHTVCHILNELYPTKTNPNTKDCLQCYTQLITHIADRPGHDTRYAVNHTQITRDLGWQPQETFASGMRKTVKWYLDNQQQII